ncbi:MAG: MarR family transcriptional regulator [Vallitalea sp.]|jgi:DNA-binding MarR family transcriptional regulator|nr:MarR family transcriptional regulator [Vallitalea sp.]
MNNKMEVVIEKFMTMTEKISGSGKKPRKFGTDVDIYRSEIHIINLIGNYSNLHVSEIARKFGVTKGAISQTLKKLERKGLVKKHLDEANNTRLLVCLTDKGQKAYINHKLDHNKMDKDMFSYLEGLDENELDIIINFIEKTSQMAERHL